MLVVGSLSSATHSECSKKVTPDEAYLPRNVFFSFSLIVLKGPK